MKQNIFGLLLVLSTVLVLTGCPNDTKPLSNNADLSALTVSTGSLSSAFAADTTAYTVSVPNGTSSITVTGVQADTTATLSPNNGMSQDLIAEENPIILTVTAEDGSTQDYIVTVIRFEVDYISINIGTLKYIPTGTFQRDGVSTENTSTVSAFRMSEKEITQFQYKAVTGSTPSNFTGDLSCPVEQVTWYDAVEFCNGLSALEGLDEVYTITDRAPAKGYPITAATVTATWTNTGYRLPTDMEWMWAAMGAASDSIGGDIVNGVNTGGYAKAFAGSDGSNVIGDYAWYDPNSGSKTHPVGTSGKTGNSNELGLYDMSGNVWEWCWERKDTYLTGVETYYKGAATDMDRIIRGGSWNNDTSYCTVAGRYGLYPGNRDNNIGFRVVRP
ncbi:MULTISPECIES: SUMF1/EgtB/PvdO family nonheme iron enzyme [unclassified Oceanispirochaeta]|uniref:SUMF1/EgtB/PvdO family nonheme iron enzyme n=1 Tax=unclassified Oceanispirochaeta TaxID=2635722 RepID=UPI000E09830E|nr:MULTISPECIES: SUMF1/EgtB/PvdO family nonheme iron enzyme [unclassified Oceanispirochaeta]MBF9018274.1 SUMF1/EgtB/PvdO family nonheme iron enzyme [Oceanispirochaeta sp. M2]NPD74739.1 SUMF1/EgtB/PvdO family nonheme iron enzyme [Oceanispirochaeta sp. M1]RDG29409.1 hypothetical protein DV872_21790 [Oceanispirochaeta sp. M1]